VRHDVEAQRRHLLDLVLRGRHDERRVGRLENIETPRSQFAKQLLRYAREGEVYSGKA